MLGTIIGDIAGSTHEFNNVRNAFFRTISKQSSFTDDTICTVAIAESVIHGTPFDESLVKWCLRYPHPMGGYGGNFSKWIHDPNRQPYYSYGNGAAMRVSSIGWMFDTLDETMTKAAESACVTHDHPEGILGAKTIASCIYHLRHGRDKDFIRQIVMWNYGIIPEWRAHSNSFDESCMNAVPVAVSCFLDGTDFESVIRKAILVGGDSDTIAAIAGSLAEAYYGIPARLGREAIRRLTPDLRRVVKTFYQTIGNDAVLALF